MVTTDGDRGNPAYWPASGGPLVENGPMQELKEGDTAPDFTLPDAGEQEVSLHQFRGRTLVLYFYPKDQTPGCTQQAREFRELTDRFRKAGAEVVGVSPDPPRRHRKFIDAEAIPFTLLADAGSAVCSLYGTWKEKSMYGRRHMGVERSTFLIDGEGRIARVWRKVRVPGHASEVLAAVGEVDRIGDG